MAGTPAYVLQLTTNLWEFQKVGYLCDTVIIVDDGQLRAHSAVLAAASSLFRNALTVQALPVERRVIMPGVQLSVAEVIVQYMYTGNFQIKEQCVDSGHLSKLQEAVKNFGMNLELVTDPRHSVQQCMNPGNQNGLTKEEENTRTHSVSADTVERNMETDGEPVPHDVEPDDDYTTACTTTSYPISDTRKGPPYVCDKCGKIFRRYQKYQGHMNTHPGDDPLMCEVCGREFPLLSNLKRHLKMHTAPRSFICDQCGASFVAACSLTQHMMVHQLEIPKKQSEPESFVCHECGETFSSKSYLNRHSSQKHNVQLNAKAAQKQKARPTCTVCGKLVNGSMTIHMRLHTGERPFKCQTCGKAFYQRCLLKSHLLTHTGVKKQTCNECGKSYRVLSVHMRMKHQGDSLPHECQLCGKRFWLSTQLRDHILLHTGEKPFQCGTCDVKFRLRRQLLNHQRLHTGTVEGTSQCTICGLRVVTGTMKRHMLVHSGERPCGCTRCNQTFRRQEQLRLHYERVHHVMLPKRAKTQALPPEMLAVSNVQETVSAIDALAMVVGDCVEVR